MQCHRNAIYLHRWENVSASLISGLNLTVSGGVFIDSTVRPVFPNPNRCIIMFICLPTIACHTQSFFLPFILIFSGAEEPTVEIEFPKLAIFGDRVDFLAFTMPTRDRTNEFRTTAKSFQVLVLSHKITRYIFRWKFKQMVIVRPIKRRLLWNLFNLIS